MKIFGLFIVLAISPLAGCQSQPRPATGLAAVNIRVIAEPKAGRPTARVAVYDMPSAAPNDPAFALVDYSDLDDIIVWLEPRNGATTPQPPPAPETLEIDAAHPRNLIVRPVSVGQTLILHNRDSSPRPIYSVSDGNEFDLGRVQSGAAATYIVKNPGLIEILTGSAMDPAAQVYAAPGRWVAISHSGAAVHFTNIPPGDYRVVSWHPRLPGTEQMIRLTAGEIASASIKVGVNSLPKVSPR